MVRSDSFFKKIVITVLLVTVWPHIMQSHTHWSTNQRADPWPEYTSEDPNDFLYTRQKNRLKGFEVVYDTDECFSFALSPFGQNACNARGLTYDCTCDDDGIKTIPIGNVENGPWGLVAMLFGGIPEGKTLIPALETAREHLFPDQESGTIEEPDVLDPYQVYGFVSFPIKYRKRGLRAEFLVQACDGFGFALQAGFADICQIVDPDLGCTQSEVCCSNGTDFTDGVKEYLICQYQKIAEELCINIRSFHDTGMEDVRLMGYWRHAYDVNRDRKGWAHLLVEPFLVLGGTVAVAKEKWQSKIFSVPFGNDGHHSIAAVAGLDFDFVETVSIGGEAGITHFFSHDFCNYRVPTSPYQTGIYPFTTAVSVSPGLNWHIGAKMSAYHFLDRLSMYFQYLFIQHRNDEIRLKTCDPAFLPWVQEQRSCWQAQLFNAGFNYDISPNMAFGFLAQWPIRGKQTYSSSTILGTFTATF